VDSRFHGNDRKIVIASVAKQSKKIYNTFGECVKTVGANNYLPLQLDSHFHGNDKKNRQSPVIASPVKSGRSNPKKNFSAKGEFMK
jgi:hypothetical protein